MQKLSFYDLYKFAYTQEASDIHLLFGKMPQIRVHGELEDCQGCVEGALKDEDIENNPREEPAFDLNKECKKAFEAE